MPVRDVMLLYLTHTTGIRLTELALLYGIGTSGGQYS